jgi:hypothetical protein
MFTRFHPRTELKFYAVLFAVLGFLLVATLVGTVPGYLRYKAFAGHEVTFTKDGYADLLRIFETFFFISLPGLGLVMLFASTRILKLIKFVNVSESGMRVSSELGHKIV